MIEALLKFFLFVKTEKTLPRILWWNQSMYDVTNYVIDFCIWLKLYNIVNATQMLATLAVTLELMTNDQPRKVTAVIEILVLIWPVL